MGVFLNIVWSVLSVFLIFTLVTAAVYKEPVSLWVAIYFSVINILYGVLVMWRSSW